MRTTVVAVITGLLAFALGTIDGKGYVCHYLKEGRYDIVAVVGKQANTEEVDVIVTEADDNSSTRLFVKISAGCWKNRKENANFLVQFDDRCYWFKDQATADK